MKRIICILLCVSTLFFLFGCGTQMERVEEDQKKKTSMFVVVEGGNADVYRIVYHRDTKVMYAISAGVYNSGCFTVLLNPDGSPMIWGG